MIDKYVCKACRGNIFSKKFSAIEMISGSKDSFVYIECQLCNTIQLENDDVDVSSYYDNASYSSFMPLKLSTIKTKFINLRNAYSYANKRSILGFLLDKLFPLDYANSCIKKYCTKLDSRVIDVGCGSGKFLHDLSSVGFRNLTGIDPFIDSDKNLGRYKILKKDMSTLDSRFDVVRLHHVFEHLPSPSSALSDIYKILAPGGLCFLTIPINDYLISRYKEDSYIIQAPHHFNIFSIKGITELITNSNFKIVEILRDSKGMSDWLKLSELWKRGISSPNINFPINQYFTEIEISKFKKEEMRLNKLSLGDNVTFVLRTNTY